MKMYYNSYSCISRRIIKEAKKIISIEQEHQKEIKTM
jgi:hypothetical protein